MVKDELKSVIKRAVINSVSNYFERNVINEENVKFQILDLLMPKERKIRSIVGGLETSMGKTLWEPLAKEIALSNEFEVVNANLESPTNMPLSLGNTLQTIIESRSNRTGLFDAKSSHLEIKRVCQPYSINPIADFQKAPRGFGVDIWLIKKGVNYFFDTKTVQPNVGSYNKFLSQVLNWYAYFYSRNPKGNAEARIVFPYNPYKVDFWKKTIGGGVPIEKGSEAWVEDEFWDFISGHKETFSLIKECFVEIYNERTLEEYLDRVFNRHREDIVVDPDNLS